MLSSAQATSPLLEVSTESSSSDKRSLGRTLSKRKSNRKLAILSHFRSTQRSPPACLSLDGNLSLTEQSPTSRSFLSIRPRFKRALSSDAANVDATMAEPRTPVSPGPSTPSTSSAAKSLRKVVSRVFGIKTPTASSIADGLRPHVPASEDEEKTLESYIPADTLERSHCRERRLPNIDADSSQPPCEVSGLAYVQQGSPEGPRGILEHANSPRPYRIGARPGLLSHNDSWRSATTTISFVTQLGSCESSTPTSPNSSGHSHSPALRPRLGLISRFSDWTTRTTASAADQDASDDLDTSSVTDEGASPVRNLRYSKQASRLASRSAPLLRGRSHDIVNEGAALTSSHGNHGNEEFRVKQPFERAKPSARMVSVGVQADVTSSGSMTSSNSTSTSGMLSSLGSFSSLSTLATSESSSSLSNYSAQMAAYTAKAWQASIGSQCNDPLRTPCYNSDSSRPRLSGVLQREASISIEGRQSVRTEYF